jgi:signal peptidase I
MSQASDAAQSPAKGTANEVVEIIKTVVYALLIALFLRVLFFQPFTIPSASMEPNLHEGDYIVVSKFSYGYSRHSVPFAPPIFHGRILERAPTRGDVAVFKTPRDDSTVLVKRIIGLPGDRIQMRAGRLYINDAQVPRQRVTTVREDAGYGYVHDVTVYRETLPGGRTIVTNDFGTDGDLDDTGVYVVPEGHYFMMGDNRDNSLDSRVAPEAGGVGYVPAENFVGRASIILMSWRQGASLFKPWTWANLDTQRFLRPLH